MNAPTRRRFWAQETTTPRGAGWVVASDDTTTPRFHATGEIPGASPLLCSLAAILRALEHCNATGVFQPTILCANANALKLVGHCKKRRGDVPRDCAELVRAILPLKATLAAQITGELRATRAEQRQQKMDALVPKVKFSGPRSVFHWLVALREKLVRHLPRKIKGAELLARQTEFWKLETSRAVRKARELQARGNPEKDITEWLERATAAATQTGLVNGSKHPLIALGLIANTTDAN